ncbi:MAG: hypothetical protein GXO79_00590 [Chlorobi bacterium]|nr:hypothetical protein [Chlorobiota bacterium]
MNKYKMKGTNHYIFHGEIIEVINSDSKGIVKILCLPDSIIVEAINNNSFNLGDNVKLSGYFHVENMELNQQNPFIN